MHSRKGHDMGASGGPTMPLHVIIFKLAVSEKKSKYLLQERIFG
jgi:hypothetical protein